MIQGNRKDAQESGEKTGKEQTKDDRRHLPQGSHFQPCKSHSRLEHSADPSQHCQGPPAQTTRRSLVPVSHSSMLWWFLLLKPGYTHKLCSPWLTALCHFELEGTEDWVTGKLHTPRNSIPGFLGVFFHNITFLKYNFGKDASGLENSGRTSESKEKNDNCSFF